MAIVIRESLKLTHRDQALADAIAMIEEAATSEEEISPFELAGMILGRVEAEMAEARQVADLAAESEVIEQFEEFGKNPIEYDPRAHSGNVRAILRQAFNKEWTGEAIEQPV